MLTAREKSILQKSTIKNGLTVNNHENPNYGYQVAFKARRKCERALEDLVFLAEIYPKAVNVDLLLKVITSYLKQESFKITLKERILKKKGLPRSLKKKLRDADQAELSHVWDSKTLVQVAGILRDKRPGYEGAPLKKNIGDKMYFCCRLLETIKQSLGDLSPINSMKDAECHFLLSYKKGKYSLDRLFDTKNVGRGTLQERKPKTLTPT